MLGLAGAGVQMDQYGLVPEALERSLAETGARIVHVTPNLQNPTLAVMPLDRRQHVIHIARKYGALVIEDDAYGPLLKCRPPSLASLDPGIVLHAASLSKSVAAGLRVGFLVVPPAFRDRVGDALRVTTCMSSPITAHIAATWIADGSAKALVEAQRREAEHRQRLATTLLRRQKVTAHPAGLHVWLQLPEPWRSAEFAWHAKEAGVSVLPSEHMAVNSGHRPQAIRVSLGAPATSAALERGLRVLAHLLAGVS
jgi:DNA-binding transcriptional MocR family regulator